MSSGEKVDGPSEAGNALGALYESRRAGVPFVTYVFLTLCLLVTIPSLLFPGLYEIFGGMEPRRFPWQVFTAVLEHGWPGFHGSFHLALNAFLILECGRRGHGARRVGRSFHPVPPLDAGAGPGRRCRRLGPAS